MSSRSELSTEALRRLVNTVGSLSCAADDAERVDRLRLLEELKAACAAAQAVEAVALDRSRRVAEAVAGVQARDQGRGVAGEVGLALRMSPYRAQRWLGWAKILTGELRAAFAELKAGRTTEWRATLLARETAVLSREDRAAVDAQLAPKLEGWGDRRVETETRAMACRLDPAAAVERASNAAADRHVSVRPAPDTMCRVSALVPVAQGVAAYAALRKAADASVATGEGRTRGQVMADTFIERLTGQSTATDVPVEITLVMTDQTLLDTSDEPARITGHGPVPADIARALALTNDAPRWLRRLFTSPDTGELVAMESRRRLFTTGQARFLRLRDDTCRTPWCDAPVRHIDHINPAANGGPTSITNGNGRCETCNYRKQTPGWISRAGPGATVDTQTPTGHRYRSAPPALPGTQPPRTPAHIVWHRAA